MYFTLIYQRLPDEDSSSPAPRQIYINDYEMSQDGRTTQTLQYIALDNGSYTEANRIGPLRMQYELPEYMTRIIQDLHTCFPGTDPERLRDHKWEYTKCGLENVVKVTFSFAHLVPSDKNVPVSGIMFTYNDGHRECVGQYRPDWEQQTRSVDPEKEESFAFFALLDNRDVKRQISRDSNGIIPDDQKFFVRRLTFLWRGTLEWRFRGHGCSFNWVDS